MKKTETFLRVLMMITLIFAAHSLAAQHYYHPTRIPLRTSAGIHISEPAGISLQVYNYTKACGLIFKKSALDISIGFEGLLVKNIPAAGDENPLPGGIRGSLGYRYYYLHRINPYLGGGLSAGSRRFHDLQAASYDFYLVAGIEPPVNLPLKPLGLYVRFYLEGYYLQSFSHQYRYIAPAAGIRMDFN